MEGKKSMNPGDEKRSLYYSDENNVNICILLSIYCHDRDTRQITFRQNEQHFK